MRGWSLLIYVKNINLLNNLHKSASIFHFFLFFINFFLWMCENRQQLTWIFTLRSCTVVQRTCVCAPFFLFFLSNKLLLQTRKSNSAWSFITIWLRLDFFFCWCARIDNNRREYFVARAAQLCNYSCVLRFFSHLFTTFIAI